MENFVINGGKELFGEVNISGAKNAAVAIIPAAILADDVVRIENIPNISDVSLIIKILDQMGADIKVVNKDTIEIDTRVLCSAAPCLMNLPLISGQAIILSAPCSAGLRRLMSPSPAVAISATDPSISTLRASECSARMLI